MVANKRTFVQALAYAYFVEETVSKFLKRKTPFFALRKKKPPLNQRNISWFECLYFCILCAVWNAVSSVVFYQCLNPFTLRIHTQEHHQCTAWNVDRRAVVGYKSILENRSERKNITSDFSPRMSDFHHCIVYTYTIMNKFKCTQCMRVCHVYVYCICDWVSMIHYNIIFTTTRFHVVCTVKMQMMAIIVIIIVAVVMIII